MLRTMLHYSAFLSVIWFSAVGAAPQNDASFELKQTIALLGVNGRIDHLAFDSEAGRLFVAALGNNSVEVVDLNKNTRAHSISGLGSPQGVVFVPELNRLIVANDNGGLCKIYDAKSFQQIGTIDLKDDADNVRYDKGTQRIYVGFGNGGIAIIDPVSARQAGVIKLAAHPEAFELETHGHRIFVNVPDAHQVAVIDREKRKVTSTWATDTASGNFPMALDEANHRLFVGCRIPPKLLVLDTDSGEVVAGIGISGDSDDLFYEAKRHRIYAICGAGKIEVIEQVDSNNYRAAGNLETMRGARTGLFAPQLNTLFVAVPRRGSQPAEIRCYEVK